MAEPASRSARSVAVEVLDRFDPRRGYAAAILGPLQDRTDQKQRATDLVFGTIRNSLAIDTIFTRFSGRPTNRIDRRLLNILRVGVYELCYSPETPDYSIVNEAVNLARRAVGPKRAGFVNAVLRGILRHIVNRDGALSESALRRTLVRTPTSGCEFDADILPDSPPAHLSVCFSLPAWLVDEWIEQFGFETARQICLASNRRPSLYVRVNPLKTSCAKLLERWQSAGVRAEVGEMIRVVGAQAVTALPGFAEGLFTVQDVSAARAACALDPQPDETILDLCAAPGTKTTQLAELTGDAATVVATDFNAGRLERLRENIARLGVKSVTVVPYEQVGPESFDAILVDAPCSNTGVLAKRVEARLRITPNAVAQLAGIQRSLLDKAATLLKPAGRIGYSTCSIQKAENADVIGAFLAAHPDFDLTSEVFILPSAEPPDHDGAYVAILAHRGD